jgi:hypothetical protein
MGLLDDAIREHLELKRLRGADPGEVAREQREALDPVPRDAHAQHDEHSSAPVGAVSSEIGEAEGSVEAAHEGSDLDIQQPVHDADFSKVGQETAELDMRTVLGEEQAAPGADADGDDDDEASPPTGLVGPAGETLAGGHAEEDSLEWEVPGASSGEQAADAGGREHVAGHEHAAGMAEGQGDAEESAEDVLEETPDFLRDTPEQERLWFEQRPPRDFDFDK